MFRGRNIHYEWKDRVRGLGAGGIGAMHLLVQRTGLSAEIDVSLKLLQVHQPYHESDHVLHIAYNILCGGKTLEDLEQLRHDEVYQDAIGARVVPDSTTAGDFTRRFGGSDIEALMAAINRVRVKVWQQQPSGSSRRRSWKPMERWRRRWASARKRWRSPTTGCGATTRWW